MHGFQLTLGCCIIWHCAWVVLSRDLMQVMSKCMIVPTRLSIVLLYFMDYICMRV